MDNVLKWTGLKFDSCIHIQLCVIIRLLQAYFDSFGIKRSSSCDAASDTKLMCANRRLGPVVSKKFSLHARCEKYRANLNKWTINWLHENYIFLSSLITTVDLNYTFELIGKMSVFRQGVVEFSSEENLAFCLWKRLYLFGVAWKSLYLFGKKINERISHTS